MTEKKKIGMTPNPTVISESSEAEEDRSFWKVIILTVFGAGFSFLSFYFFNKFLTEGDADKLIWTALFAVLFFALFILQVFFLKSRLKLAFLIFLQAVSPITVFYPRVFPKTSLILIAGFAVFFVFLWGGAMKGQRELLNSLTIRFFSVAKNVMPRAVSGFLIFLSLVLYLTYFVWGGFNDNLAKKLVDQTLDFSEPIVSVVLTDISFKTTVDDFLGTLAESQLRKIGGGDGFQLLPPADQERVIQEVALGLKLELEKVVGPLNGEAGVNDETYRIVKDYVEGLPAATKSAVSIAVVVFFFFAARGIAFLLYWLPEFISFVIYKSLLIIGFAYINLENRRREFIMLS